MRTQEMKTATTKATRSRKPASTKKAASAAKAPTKGLSKGIVEAVMKTGDELLGKSGRARSSAKAKTTGKMNGVAAAKTSNRGARSAAGSKSQAAKPAKSSKRSAGKSQQRRSAGSAKPSSQSGAATAGRQGEGTMSTQAAPMFGGTKQVLIEEVAMTNRGGRKQGPEPYPFGDLTPSRVDGSGAILGPSFFIPDSEKPKRIIAAGRKRHKPSGKVFLTRQMEGPSAGDPNVKVSGTRVWLAPAGYKG